MTANDFRSDVYEYLADYGNDPLAGADDHEQLLRYAAEIQKEAAVLLLDRMKAAKNTGGLTFQQIGDAVGISRQSVYKRLYNDEQ